MLFLIAVIAAALFAWFCAEPLRKNPVPFYIGAAVVTVGMILLGQADLSLVNPVIQKYVIGIFTRGALSAALWCVVAYAGAMPVGSAPIKKLMPARWELSIFAAIVTVSHAVTWSVTYIQRLLKFSEAGRSPSADFVVTCIVCVLLMVIMLPLTVISFKAIRKKMKPKTWKNIQRAAYVFYALIYLHVMVIFIPRARAGRDGAMLSVIVYSLVFLGYAVLRLRKLYVQKRKPETRALLNTVSIAALILCVGTLGIVSRNTKPSLAAETPAETTAPPAASETVTETMTETAATTAASAETTTAQAEETEISSETETTAETEETTGTEASSETTAESGEAPAATEAPAADQPEAPAQADPVQPEEPQTEAPTEPEPVYIYNNGTFTGHGVTPMDAEKDYEGYVDVRVTSENDVITGISVTGWGDDPDYYWMAEGEIVNRMMAAQNWDVDAVCGATRSAEGMKEAVRNALDSARK